MSMIVLTPSEAYLAMIAFLQNYWERGHSSKGLIRPSSPPNDDLEVQFPQAGPGR